MSLVYSLAGTDLSTKNIYCDGVDQSIKSAVAVAFAGSAMPGRLLATLQRNGIAQGKPVSFPFLINTNTLSARETAEDWIKGYLRQSVTFRRDDGVNTAREVVGNVIGVTVLPIGLPNSPVARGTLQMQLSDPTWRATATTTTAISATPATVALGNAPVEDWVLTVTGTGALTGPITVTIGGPASYSMSYALGLAAGHTLTISAALFSVVDNATDHTASWSGDGFPALDPMGGATAVTMAVAAASGTLSTCTLTALKRYY